MKTVDASSLVFHFLCIFFFLWSGFFSGVSTDSDKLDESTLDIQPTLLVTRNISDNTDNPETDINPSEGNLVPNNEGHISGKDTAPADLLNEVLEPVFSEVNSGHTGVTNEIINNDTPIVISRIDSATEELQKRAKLPLSDVDNTSELAADTIETNITNTLAEQDEDRSDTNTTLETDTPKNLTDKNAEEIPSFSEWAQKHLEEVEKKEQVNFSTPAPAVNNTKQVSGAKLRWKNYASVDCGAKVILANPEAQHTWAILVGSRDEYILNPCNRKIWFIVELCEAIQLKKVDLANYELFSSSPKDFTVSVSDRFPTRDWSVVGQFTAKDERDVQSFDVTTEQTFGKYVKIEIKSHYGSEHYCPLSLFRAYGMSVFEVLQKEDPAHQQPIDDDDDDDDVTLDHSSKGDTSGNLLSSATDAVLSMVKKAAQVLGNKVNKTNESSQTNENTKSSSPITKSCSSPSHYVVCNNCSDMLFGKIYELMSCRQKQIRNLVNIPFITKALLKSVVCQVFGFDFRDKNVKKSIRSGSVSVESFFPPSYLGAMCNSLAITQNKVFFNISHQYTNTTEIMPGEDLIDVNASAPKVIPVIDVSSKESLDETNNKATDPLNIDWPDINSKSSCSTDTKYISQIKPTKSILTDLPLHQEVNTGSASFGQASTQQIVENAEQQKIPVAPPAEATIMDTSTEVPAAEADLSTDGAGEDNVDKIMTELNSDANPSSVNTAASNVQGQKESVFLRLSNRIKALERNMSLSGQYLEELSKRYKKQVEEMQRVLDKTEQTLNEVASKEEQRHKQLEDRLESLTKALENLSAEKDAWKTTSYWLFFVVGFIFLVYCFIRLSQQPKPTQSDADKPVEIQRRNSVDVVTSVTPKKKTRRPSDQALKIVASSAGDQEKPRKRKKKNSSLNEIYNRSNSDGQFSPPCTSSKIWNKPASNNDWVEGKGRIIEGIPFVLDDIDSSTLDPLPLAKELSAIEAPGFVRTAANVRMGRSSLRNGTVANLDGIVRRQSSPGSSVNGSISSVNEQTPKKEKKGFKKLFKKVF